MPVGLIFGGASWADESSSPVELIKEVLDILEDGGVKTIDTATIYGQSEELLGKADAASRFKIDTKFPGSFRPEPASKEIVIATAEDSLNKLKTDQVDIYYLHSPDRRTPLEETLEAINSLYKAGKFRRFGVSNFLAEEVEEIIRISKEKNYVLPSVYQGNYSAVARHVETEILPTLRKHNISFYAYSPIAGGFLTKDVDTLLAGGEGRWDPNTLFGKLYHGLYNKPGMLEGLRLWGKIATDAGIPKAELAYRWIIYNSQLKEELGDHIIFGATKNEQLRQTLASAGKGPLSAEIAQQVEEVWKTVEADSPLDNFNSSKKE